MTGKNPTRISKFFYLLNNSQKKQLIYLFFLLLIGMFFEVLGIGILIPILSLLMDSNIGNKYPNLLPFLKMIGSPSQFKLVIYGMSFLVIIYLSKTFFLMYLSWKQSSFSANLSASISEKLYYGYLMQPYIFHLNRNSAFLINNISGEVVQFSAITQSALIFIVELSAIIGVFIMLIFIEPIGALSVTIILALLIVIFYKLFKSKLSNWGKSRLYHASMMSKLLSQGLGAVKDVIVLSRSHFFLDVFSEHNLKHARIQSKVNTLNLAPRLYLELFAVIGLSILIILMALQHKPLENLIPTIAVFVAAAFRMIPSGNRIMASIQQIQYIDSSLDRLYKDFLLLSKSVYPNFNQKNQIILNNEIDIFDLSYAYPDTLKNAVNKINLKVKKGETIGLIGPSGSGKSTTVDLILGLLNSDSGKILIDGIDINSNINSWRSQIGYVSQSIYLIDDTLINNIAFGLQNDQINIEKINTAIKYAQLEEFIEGLPLKLNTIVGERGVRLSGGQRQRIGIARAMYNNPPILILDEATSALDNETEKAFMDSIQMLKADKTIIIIAHRLTTVEKCDRIYKIVDGEITSYGVPQEVLLN